MFPAIKQTVIASYASDNSTPSTARQCQSPPKSIKFRMNIVRVLVSYQVLRCDRRLKRVHSLPYCRQFFPVCLLLIHKSMMMMMMINLYGNKIPLSARAFPSSPPSDAILSLSLCNIYMCNVHSTLTLLSWLAKIFAHSAEKYLHTANKNELW